MLEVICRAPYGQTFGYRRERGRVLPCVEEGEEAAFLEMGYDQYIEGILEFTTWYHKSVGQFPLSGTKIDMMYQYLRYLSEEPSEDILNFFGDLPNNETGRETNVIQFAPALSPGDLRHLFLYRTTEPVEWFYEGTYLDYSLLRCSAKDSKKIAFYRKNQGKLLGKAYRWLKGFWLEDKIREKACSQKGKIGQKKELYEIDPVLLRGRIALYAAGKVGQSLYRQIRRTKNAQLVLWVDRESDKYDEKVESLEHLKEISFDRLVVAVLKKEVGDAIQEQLVEMGISEDRIFQYYVWRI